ncbi:MAG TPA: type II toxin-antitoxin system RelE/ParE family toxin [Caulobacter sp.]|nr:type II toxin-antitoxin system RelE/ParE family toxin [Caulobacter sp.]
MVQVVWSRRALAELAAIRAYIDQFSPLAAQRMAVRLKAAGDSLSSFPDRGRPVAPGIRELVVIYPYIIRYRVKDDQVGIIRIRHGAQEPD